MRKFIDKEDLLGNVVELTNDWGYGMYCVYEEDVMDAPEQEVIEVDWIVDYVEEHLTEAEADVVKRMVGTWYDEFNAEVLGKKKKAKPTLTEAFNKGFKKGACSKKEDKILCKDCMYFHQTKRTTICDHDDAAVNPVPEGYCNFAERK